MFISKVYDKFECQDEFPFDCNELARTENGCHSSDVLIDDRTLNDTCPRTCNRCNETRLRCSHQICENDAICIDYEDDEDEVTRNNLIAFRCICQPGFFGDFCEISMRLIAFIRFFFLFSRIWEFLFCFV